jgi:AcrR family transcriptional regulator
MASRLTQATRTQAAREHIVQAAIAVFALKGFASASMEDICLVAGCSKGGLYHHFRGKRAVLGGVVDHLASSGALLPPLETHEGGVPPGLGRVLVEVWAEAARDASLRAQLRRAYESGLAEDPPASPFANILRMGALIQLLTLDGEDATELASRVGRAA